MNKKDRAKVDRIISGVNEVCKSEDVATMVCLAVITDSKGRRVLSPFSVCDTSAGPEAVELARELLATYIAFSQSTGLPLED